MRRSPRWRCYGARGSAWSRSRRRSSPASSSLPRPSSDARSSRALPPGALAAGLAEFTGRRSARRSGLRLAPFLELHQRRQRFDLALGLDLALAHELYVGFHLSQIGLDFAQALLQLVAFGLQQFELDRQEILRFPALSLANSGRAENAFVSGRLGRSGFESPAELGEGSCGRRPDGAIPPLSPGRRRGFDPG